MDAEYVESLLQVKFVEVHGCDLPTGSPEDACCDELCGTARIYVGHHADMHGHALGCTNECAADLLRSKGHHEEANALEGNLMDTPHMNQRRF